ncbi:hypothetical protein ACFX2G_034806 [Malus domestica]
MVEGDSNLVIEAIRGTYNSPWRLRTILEDIRWLAELFSEISYNHALKEVNFLADAITRVRFSVVDFHVWDNSIPVEASRTFLFDCTQTNCHRSFSL